MIKDIIQRFGMAAVAVVLAAFAGGIAFVAIAYALFAVLEHVVSPAGSAAITAAAFAIVATVIAAVAPRAAPKKEELVAIRPRLDPATMRLATEAGVAALGIFGDIALNRRLKREEKALKTLKTVRRKR